jgi:hypothetical protein
MAEDVSLGMVEEIGCAEMRDPKVLGHAFFYAFFK